MERSGCSLLPSITPQQAKEGPDDIFIPDLSFLPRWGDGEKEKKPVEVNGPLENIG